MPSRLLSSEKIAKGECRVGEKMNFSIIDYAEPPRPLSDVKLKRIVCPFSPFGTEKFLETENKDIKNKNL